MLHGVENAFLLYSNSATSPGHPSPTYGAVQFLFSAAAVVVGVNGRDEIHPCQS